jgi:ribonuclease G
MKKSQENRASKKIIINSTLNEVRVAITERDKLDEFFIELPEKERIVGNIYFGKVTRIVQGINAAFINIGLKQDAFLHFSDVDESMEGFIKEEDEGEFLTDDEDSPQSIPEEKLNRPNNKDKKNQALRKNRGNQKVVKNQPTFSTKKSGQININLKEGQEVVVQVVREAYSSKGVKVSTRIGLPGRYVVLLPFDNIVGVSRKIFSFTERKRLRMLAKLSLPEGFGCIIRTAAAGKSEEELRKDWTSLLENWKEIEARIQKCKGPELVHQDMTLAASIIRDLFNNDIESVHVDSKKLHKEIITYLKRNSPNLVDKVFLVTDSRPIFDVFGIEKDLAQTYKRKVNLPSGGSIVIDQTEAMFVVDVNSGRTSEQEQEKNAYKTNSEAVREIARQVRLRDIAGMIIVDFIDMGHESNRKKLFHEMKSELTKDRAKTVVYPITQLGLMQMTRQRINQNITEKTSDICPMCSGSGRITSKVVLLNSIERWLKNFRQKSREFRITLMIHPNMAEYLTEGTISRISRIMIKYFVKIKIQQNINFSMDEFRFYSGKTEKDITKDFL